MNLTNKPWPLGEKYHCDNCGADYKLDKDGLAGIQELNVATNDAQKFHGMAEKTAKIKCDLCGRVGELTNQTADDLTNPVPATVENPAKVTHDNPTLVTRDGTIPQTLGKPEQSTVPADDRTDLTPGEYAHLKMHEAAADGPDLLPGLRDDQEAGTVAYSHQSTDQVGETRIRTEGAVVTSINTVGDFPLPDSQEALIESRADLPVTGELVPGIAMTHREATPTGKLKAESKRIQHDRSVAEEKEIADADATDIIKAKNEGANKAKAKADAKQERVNDRQKEEAKEQAETVAPRGDGFGTVDLTVPTAPTVEGKAGETTVQKPVNG